MNNIYKKFKRDGYIIVKNICDKNKLNNVLKTFCKTYFKKNPSSKFLTHKKPWSSENFHKEVFNFRKKNKDEFGEIFDTCRNSITVNEIVTDKKMLKTVSKLLNTDPIFITNYENVVRIDVPYDKRNKAAWHQEVQFFNNPGLVMWLPLVKINKESGLLNVLKGSHIEGELNFIINKKFNYTKARSATCEIPKKTLSRLFINYKKIKIKVGIGDVLFFDNYLLHSSGKNKSNFIRFVTNTRFFDSNSNEYVPFRPSLLYNPYSMKKFSNRKFY